MAFFEQALWPRLRHGGIVYVLPEVKPLVAAFPEVKTSAARTVSG